MGNFRRGHAGLFVAALLLPLKMPALGAAEPVLMGETGKLETASEKINSALRADFANRARFFDRNPLLAERC